MKGLLLKEWYGFCRNTTMPWFVLACFRIFTSATIFSGWNEWSTYSDISGLFLIAIQVLLACSASFIMEERENWDVFRGILPFSSKEIVASKYIFTSVLLAFITIITAIFLCIPLYNKQATLTECTAMLVWITSLSLCFVSLMLPGLLKFKGKKRLFYFIIIFVFLLILLTIIFSYVNANLNQLSEAIKQERWDITTSAKCPIYLDISPMQQIFIIGTSIIVYLLSWILSIKLYENRDA